MDSVIISLKQLTKLTVPSTELTNAKEFNINLKGYFSVLQQPHFHPRKIVFSDYFKVLI